MRILQSSSAATTAPAARSPDAQTEHSSQRQTHAPYITLVVLGTIVLTPYILVRSRLVSLHREIAIVKAANSALRRDTRSLALDTSARQKENQRVMELLEETKGSVDKLRAQMEEHQQAQAGAENKMREELREMRQTLERLEADGVQRDHARAEWESMRRSDLQAIARSNEQTKTQMSAMRDIGTSLADVAAFMQEVELQHGYTPRKGDGGGVERIRHLAKHLQELPTLPTDAEVKEEQDAVSNSDSTSGSNPRTS